MIKLAVLGYGNIGSGVVEVLLKNKEFIAQKAGDEIEPVCVLDIRDYPGDVMANRIVRDIRNITEDPEISVVVETIGGTKFAYPYVKQCLEAGKHVVTSNKALVAAHGEELLRIAEEKKVNFLFEASTGGGIPVIRALTGSIVADRVTGITGILNGTTNYMLSEMAEHPSYELDEVLQEAKTLGYAEQDPTADVEGTDACRKTAILASLAFGRFIDYEEIPTQGITDISALDMNYARAAGGKLKLLGTCQRDEAGRITARVSPMLVKKGHPLYAVSGVMNAVLVRGELMGDLIFYGAGAGKLPTACAVVEDVVTAVRRGNDPEIKPFPEERAKVSDDADLPCCYLVRLRSSKDGEDERFAAACGDGALLSGLADGEYAVITRPITEGEFRRLAEAPCVIRYFRLAE